MGKRLRKSMAYAVCLAVMLCSAIAGIILMNFTVSKAEDRVSTVEYTTIDATEMQIGYTESAGQDPVTRDITLNNGCRVGFTNIPRNLEITATVNFSVMEHPGAICIVLRGEGNSILPVPYVGSGYAFMAYANGMYSLYDNGVDVNGNAQWGSLALTPGTDYQFSMKAVDLADGSGVQVVVMINGTQVIEYNDITDPIMNDGMAGITAQNGASFTIKGKGVEQTQAVNPTYLSSAIPVQDLALPGIDETGSLQWVGLAAEGAGYNIQTDGFYSIKTNIAPSSGIVSMSVGSYRTNANTMQLFHVMDAQWGWTDTGYHFDWANTGAITISRSYLSAEGIKSRTFTATAVGFGPGSVYDVEFGFDSVNDGVVKVFLKVNGAYAFIIYDSATDDGYEPYKMRTTTPSDQTMTSLIYGQWCSAKLTFDEVPQVVNATQLGRDLGTPDYTSANTGVNRNGEITSFVDDAVVYGYNSISANSIETTFNFEKLGTVLMLMTRIPAVIMSPWGEGSGYGLYLRSTGQITFTKNGAVLCEGWAPFAGLNATDTDFVVKYGAVNLAEDAVQIFAYVNDVCILNFVDIGDTLQGSGYMVYNMGFSGSALSYGVAMPVVSSDASELYLQESATLSCQNGGEVTEYFVDEELSSGKAIIDGNELLAKIPGEVYVYAVSDGVYSESIVIKINGSAAAITNIPLTALTARGDVYQLEYELINGDEISSVLFEIVEGKGTGKAELTTEGLFTPIDAGTVVVRVTINGIVSPDYTIYIKPVIYIDNTAAMAVGEVRNSSGFYANCLLPDENYTVTYELVDGEEYVTMNSMGQIQANKIGIFWIRVTVKGETFEATSGAAGIQVEAPVVTLTGVDDMVVGESLQFYPAINKGIEVHSAVISVLEGADCISIDENNVVTALKAGVVKVVAVVNGFSSGSLWFQVADLSLSIIAGDMFAADTQPLNIMFNADIIELDTVEYSIISGSEFASLDNGVIVSGNESGTVTIGVVVNDKYKAETTINIISGVSLTGIFNNAMIPVDAVIQLSYLADRFDEVTSEDYIIVDGAEYGKIVDGKLVVTAPGKITVKAVINGVESLPITVYSYSAYSPVVVLEGIYNGAEFAVGSKIELSYTYSGFADVTSAAYEIVTGTDIAEISDNVLTVKGAGEITVRVVVNGVASEEISIAGYVADEPIVVLTGIYEGIQFTVGDSIVLSYAYSGSDEVKTVEYKVVSGKEYATVDGNKLNLIAEGNIQLCVIVNGISSSDVNITVKNPVVVLTGGLYDGAEMTVGDIVSLSYLFSGQTVNSVKYEIVDGADKATIDGNKLMVTKSGSISVKVVINVFSSEPITITAVNPVAPVAVLLGVYDGEEFDVGNQIELSYFYSGSEDIFKVEYVMVDGSSLAVLNNNVLTFTGAGRIGIAVRVNGTLSDALYITVVEAEKPVAVLLGVNNGQKLEIGTTIELSYFFSGDDVKDVEYKIVSGEECAKLDGNMLTIMKTGEVGIKVIVDGVESEVVMIAGYEMAEPSNLPYTVAIIAACVFGVALVATTALCIARRKRR